MKHIFSIVLFLMLSIALSAQTVFKGKVFDEKNAPIEGVFVSFLGNKTIIANRMTDAMGTFELETKADVTSIIFSCLGYGNVTIEVSGIDKKDIRITMKEAALKLKPAVVKEDIVNVKADTVTFDAGSFTQRTDNTLKQVLVRIPGVTVSEQGAVRYMGDPISRFYIEDLDLLGARYGIAVNNLNPQDVASVQVYKNYQDKKVLQGVVFASKPAMNIKLKAKAKAKWIWSTGAALGCSPLLYSAEMTAMRFDKGSQTIALAKSNNIGKDIKSDLDMLYREPGVYLISNSNTDNYLFPIYTRKLQIPKDYYYLNTSHVASVNNLTKLSRDAQIRTHVSFIRDSYTDEGISQQTLTLPDSTKIGIDESDRMAMENRKLAAELTYTKNARTDYFEDAFSLGANWDEGISSIRNSDTSLVQDYRLPKIELENKITAIFRKGKEITNFKSDIVFRHRDQSLTVDDGQSQLLKLDEMLNENYLSRTFALHGGWTYVLSPGIDLNYQKLYSLYDMSGASNDISLFTLSPYVENSFSLKAGGLEMSSGISAALRTDILGEKKKTYFLLKPQMYIKYSFMPSWDVMLYAYYGNRVGDIRSMADNMIMHSYRTYVTYDDVDAGNDADISLSLHYSNIVTLFTMAANAGYSTNRSSLVPSDTYDGIYLVTQYLSRPHSSGSAYCGLEASRYFSAIKLGLSAEARYDNTTGEQYFQDVLVGYRTGTASVKGSVKYRLNQLLEAYYDFKLSKTAMTESGSVSEIGTMTNKAEVNVTPLRNFSLNCSFFQLYQYSGIGNPFSHEFLDAGLQYSFGQNRIYIQCRNLLNTDKYEHSYFSTISSITSSVTLRPRQFTIGADFKF